MPPPCTASDAGDRDPCFVQRVHARRRVPGVQAGSLRAFCQTGAWLCAVPPPMPFARSRLPLPARRALLRLRSAPRDGRRTRRCVCRPRPTCAASWFGLEGVDPRHRRGDAASTRRCFSGLPLRRCAVPRTPQPVARLIDSRGCAFRRASSPRPPAPECEWPSCAPERTGSGLDRASGSGCPGRRLHRIGAFRPGRTPRGVSLSHSALPSTFRSRPQTRPKPAWFLPDADRLQGVSPPTSP